MNYSQLVLKSGRDRSVRNRHPWIYSGAVKTRPAKVGEGEIVAVCTNDGEVLGLGHYAPQSTLICRMFHFGGPNGFDSGQSVVSALEFEACSRTKCTRRRERAAVQTND